MTQSPQQQSKASPNSNGTKETVENAASETDDFYRIVGKIVDAVVQVAGFPFYVAGRILENFMDYNKAGVKILAALAIVGGVVLSADGFYQWFGGKPLFPWWEDTWIRWGWLTVWMMPNFWGAILVSLGVQWLESKAIRGKKPDEAKSQYEESKHHTLPDQNPKNIDIVKAYWRDYKKSGMGERRLLGLFILLVFIGDFAATFSARNPWGRPPGEFIAMTGSNLIIMIAGEAGFILWRKTVKH